jgi:hypothetical protein
LVERGELELSAKGTGEVQDQIIKISGNCGSRPAPTYSAFDANWGSSSNLSTVVEDSAFDKGLDDFSMVFIEEALNVWDRHLLVNEQIADCQGSLSPWFQIDRVFRQGEVIFLKFEFISKERGW